MTEERDIVNFAFPFAAGVLSASFLPAQHSPLAAGLSMLLCLIPAIRLMSSSTRCGHPPLTYTPIITLAFLSGATCMITACSTDIYALERVTFLEAVGERFCSSLRLEIYSVPFAQEETGSILSALITGDRSMLSQETVRAFRDSGAAHILALSGLHLGIIYGIIRKVTSPLGNGINAHRLRSVIIIAACGFYSIATGAGESIVRAFLFIMLHEIAGATFRYSGIRQVLPAALFIQLVTDPSAIRSVSFQLSYAAMAGIAYIYPSIKEFWPSRTSHGRPEPFRKIWNAAALSISCQITTSPLAWHYFNTFPQHFLLANLIALPLTGLIIPAALLTVALHSIGICPEALISTTEVIVTLLGFSLETIAGM